MLMYLREIYGVWISFREAVTRQWEWYNVTYYRQNTCNHTIHMVLYLVRTSHSAKLHGDHVLLVKKELYV
jgi:hypothetical protein